MSEGDRRPRWNDPSSPTTRPTGTGSGAYVEQPEPRANPLTVEGEIAMIGDFASGAARARGWRGVLARGIVMWCLFGFVVFVVFEVVSIVR